MIARGDLITHAMGKPVASIDALLDAVRGVDVGTEVRLAVVRAKGGGYAWGIGHGRYRGRAALQHGGRGPATTAHLLIIPELEFGVVASASGEVAVNPYVLATRAADAVLGARLAPVEPPRAGPRMMMITEAQMREVPDESRGVLVKAEEVARLAGTYVGSSGDVIVVRARGDSLELAPEGRDPWFPMFPIPDGRFMTVPLRRAYRFTLPRAGAASQVTVDRGPHSILAEAPPQTYTRIPDRQFAAATAAPFVGLYYSDELGTVYEVVTRDSRLELVHARHGRLTLIPLGEHRFAVQGAPIVGATFAPGEGGMIGLELEARSWGARASFRRLRQ